ncbi:hypothetical protein BJY01DRAFT_90670 [Aspergillus pseudoustus]|uniref:Uncharacterized protein n=1 Tax=Aspergillus pseudoustus TaxID=1810923 RepID=A0ABR4J0N2_9EURO
MRVWGWAEPSFLQRCGMSPVSEFLHLRPSALADEKSRTDLCLLRSGWGLHCIIQFFFRSPHEWNWTLSLRKWVCRPRLDQGDNMNNRFRVIGSATQTLLRNHGLSKSLGTVWMRGTAWDSGGPTQVPRAIRYISPPSCWVERWFEGVLVIDGGGKEIIADRKCRGA